MFAKYKTQTGNTSLDIMTVLTENYNTNIHSSTKSRPIDLHPNKNNVTIDKTNVKVEDNIFDKKYEKQWSHRIYKVFKISRPDKYKNLFYILQNEKDKY